MESTGKELRTLALCAISASIAGIIVYVICDLAAAWTALAVALLTFSICYAMTAGPGGGREVLPCSHVESCLMALVAISIAILALVPPASKAFFTAWERLGPGPWARMIAAFLLTSFLPGSMLLGLLVGDLEKVGPIELVVFSYVLSVFVISVAGFVLLCLGACLSGCATQLVISVNLALLAAYLAIGVVRRGRAGHGGRGLGTKLRWDYGLALLAVVIFVLTMTIEVLSWGLFPLPKWDPWTEHGFGVLFLEKGFPTTLEGRLVHPYWFYIYLATFFGAAGAPTVNAYAILFSLNVMPVLAFFLLARSLLGDRAGLLATLIFVFSGFGGLFVIALKAASAPSDLRGLFGTIYYAAGRTWDIGLDVHYAWPHCHLAYLPALTAFFAAAFLVSELRSKRKWPPTGHLALFSLSLAVAHLTHVVEGVTFVFVVLPLALILLRPPERCSIALALAAVASSVMVLLTDLAAPVDCYQLFRLRISNWSIPLFPCSLPFVGAVILTDLGIRRALSRWEGWSWTILSSSGQKRAGLLRHGRLAIGLPAIYLYGLSFLIWADVKDDFNVIIYGASNPVLPFFLPIRWGVAGALVLASIFLLHRRELERKELLFLVSWFIAALLLSESQAVAFYGMRMGAFAYMALAMLAGLGLDALLAELVRRGGTGRPDLEMRANSLKCAVLTAIILLGAITPIFKTEFKMLKQMGKEVWWESEVSEDEIAALSFLRAEFPASYAAAADRYQSLIRLKMVGMIDLGALPPLGTDLLFRARGIEGFLKVLSNSRVRYLFVSDRDRACLSRRFEDSLVTRFLLDHLSLAVRTDTVSIYEVPDMTPPAEGAPLGIVVPREVVMDALSPTAISCYIYPVAMAALAQASYRVLVDGDAEAFRSSVLVLASDPGDGIKDYLGWLRLGRPLVILDGSGPGQVFGSSILYGGEVARADGIKSELRGTLIPLPEVSVPRAHANEEQATVLAWYTCRGREVAPFALRTSLQGQDVFLLDVFPLFDAMLEGGPEVKRDIFGKLGLMLELLPIEIPGANVEPDLGFWSGVFSLGGFNATGSVDVEADWLYVPIMDPAQNNPAFVHNCNYLGDWSIFYGEGNITLDTYDFVEGGASLKVSITAQEGGHLAVSYRPPERLNWTGVKFLELWFKADFSPSDVKLARIYVYGDKPTFMFWNIRPEIAEGRWIGLALPLDSPDGALGTLDMGRVRSILLYFQGEPGRTYSFWLDDVCVDISSWLTGHVGSPTATIDLRGAEHVDVISGQLDSLLIPNAMIQSLRIRREVHVGLSTSRLEFHGGGLDKYVLLTLGDEFHVDLSLSWAATIDLAFVRRGITTRLSIRGGTLSLTIRPAAVGIEVMVGRASISVRGRTSFGEIYVPQLRCYRHPLAVEGRTSFVLGFSDNAWRCLDGFSYQGSIEMPRSASNPSAGPEVDWEVVLLSPWHLAFTASLAAVGLMAIWRDKRRQRRGGGGKASCDRPIRVLYIGTNDLSPGKPCRGGTMRLALEILRHIGREGVLARYERVSGSRSEQLARLPSLAGDVLREGIDVIHLLGIGSHALTALSVAKMAGRPLITTVPASPYDEMGELSAPLRAKLPWLALEKAVVEFSERLVVTSKWQRGRLAHYYGLEAGRKAVVIYPGADHVWPPVGGEPSKEPWALCVTGSLRSSYRARRKGLDLLFEICRLCPDVRFFIVGPSRRQLEAHGPPPGNLEATGHLPDHELYELMRMCAVILAPSRHEAFNISCLEAMALGCVPLVSTNCGISELLSGLGLVLPLSPEAFSAKVRQMVNGGWRWLAPRLVELARQFTWGKAVERLAGLYRDVLNRPGGGA